MPCMPPSWTQSPKIAAHLQIFPRVPGSHSQAAGTMRSTTDAAIEATKQTTDAAFFDWLKFSSTGCKTAGRASESRVSSKTNSIQNGADEIVCGDKACHSAMQKELQKELIAYLSVSASAVPMRAAFMPPTSVSKIESNGLVSAFPCIYFLFRGIFSFHLCWCEIFKLIQDEPVKLGDARCLPVANVVQPGRPLQHCRNSGTAMWRRKNAEVKQKWKIPYISHDKVHTKCE